MDVESFGFIIVGFLLTAIVPTFLLFSYPVLKRLSLSGARTLLRCVGAVYLGGCAAAMLYAITSGEWRLFVDQYGISTFLQLALLALVYFFIMYFMASRSVSLREMLARDAIERQKKEDSNS